MSNISSIIVFNETVIFNMGNAGNPMFTREVNAERTSNGERFIYFNNSDELGLFLESIGYEPEDTYCYGGDDWDDNAISEYDLIVWAKDEMDINVDRRNDR